jgi:hypothetical protein
MAQNGSPLPVYEEGGRGVFLRCLLWLHAEWRVIFVLLPSDYAATPRGALGTLFFASSIVFWRDMQEGAAATDLGGQNPVSAHLVTNGEEQFICCSRCCCYRAFATLGATLF